ncbi:hypothetical protein BMI79_11425 [Serratia oryzae]|uniref:Uncharacterized protein n=1 Tax=Serratia oryzae TaxID=2034155 RepID=A0A1S8CKE7_9GAMM|nr:hypothetical protein BMI79_11425 [Serratia oryzae]
MCSQGAQFVIGVDDRSAIGGGFPEPNTPQLMLMARFLANLPTKAYSYVKVQKNQANPCQNKRNRIYPSYFKLLGCWLRDSAHIGPHPFGAAASSVQICLADLSLTPVTYLSKLLGMMSLF